MGTESLTLAEAREKLGAKQADLKTIFDQAKTNGGKDGKNQYDFNKVTFFGADVKGSIAVAEKVHALNLECNELAKHSETLELAERAAGDHGEREKARRGDFRAPTGGDKDQNRDYSVKSLGEMVSGEKDYRGWATKGAAGGITLDFPDLLPSQMLAKGMQFSTVGNKALMSTAAGYAPQSIRLPGFVEAATRPIQLLDIIPTSTTGMEQIVYMEETTRAHAAAEVAEGSDYPESSFVFTERTSSVRKIGDSLPVTDEQLEDVAMMEGYIDGRLTFGVRQRLDGQVLIGDATNSNLRGIANVAGIQTLDAGADPVPDAFMKAMTKVRVGGRALPTHNVIHPEDWQGVKLMRTADGVYIWGAPSEAGVDRLWGLPVVQEDIQEAGTGYVGSFLPSYLSLFEKRGVVVQVGYVGSQFTQGKRTVRADMRAAFVVFRPAAFVEVTLD